MYETILNMFKDSLPAIVVGAVSYLFWVRHFKNEENRRNFLLAKDNQKITTPIRLQAYERIILLLERVNPKNLLLRFNIVNNQNLNDYRILLIDNINKEFEHNFSQQLYLSEEVWDRVLESKIHCINMINIVYKSSIEKENPISDFKDKILELTLKKGDDPTKIAIEIIKREAKRLYRV